METNHRIITADSRHLSAIADASIDLVITSPPYPMIEMWDAVYSVLSPDAAAALGALDGNRAFAAMHVELDKTWGELYRILKPGSFACINIGDATRTIDGRFRLYSNHSRIISAFRNLGFDTLPVVIWRKQTNAPNKFMGSGMLPSGAYVTLEHEYILIFRKEGKKEFKTAEEKSARMKSAFFWEERNKWFSDVWDFKGVRQRFNHNELRARSGAYPFELPYRLINMYSLYGDTVLDPFLGTGTTTLAAIACGRSSIGFEIDPAFSSLLTEQAKSFVDEANRLLSARIAEHHQFVEEHASRKGPLSYTSMPHGLPVVTRQETAIELYRLVSIDCPTASTLKCHHELLEDQGAGSSTSSNQQALTTNDGEASKAQDVLPYKYE